MKNISDFINEELIIEGLSRKQATKVTDVDFEGDNSFGELAINIKDSIQKFAPSKYKKYYKDCRGIYVIIDDQKDNWRSSDLSMKFIDSKYKMPNKWCDIDCWKLESPGNAKDEIIKVFNHLVTNEKAMKEFIEYSINFSWDLNSVDGNTKMYRTSKNSDEHKLKMKDRYYTQEYLKWLEMSARPLTSLLKIK
jgi:hypothetical protein